MWVLWAFGSALCAGLSSVLAKCGVKHTDPTLATALRTVVVLAMAWAVVFLAGASRGVIPLESPGRENDPQEERRLFYVGATRAKHTLELLTYEKKFGEPVQDRFPFVSQLLGEPVRSPQSADTPAPQWELDFIPGAAVVHRQFGPGVIQSRTGNIAVIHFDSAGPRRLDLTACRKGRLLRRADEG